MDVTKLLTNYNFRSKLLALYVLMKKSNSREAEPFHCPHCGENSALTSDKVSFNFNYAKDQDCLFVIAYLGCSNPNCMKTTILCEEIYLKNKTDKSGYDIANFIVNTDAPDKIIYPATLHCFFPIRENPELVYPHNEDKDFIPSKILEDFLELQRISNLSTTATVMFARRFLERIILDKWPEVTNAKKWRYEFPTLDEMINWLDEDCNGQKRYANADAMDSLRRIGNKTIHIYSPTEDIEISSADIDEITAELDAIIEELYIIPKIREQRHKRIADLAQKASDKSKVLLKETTAGTNS